MTRKKEQELALMKHSTRYQLPWQVLSHPALWTFQHPCARQAASPLQRWGKWAAAHVTQPVAGGRGPRHAPVCLPLRLVLFHYFSLLPGFLRLANWVCSDTGLFSPNLIYLHYCFLSLLAFLFLENTAVPWPPLALIASSASHFPLKVTVLHGGVGTVLVRRRSELELALTPGAQVSAPSDSPDISRAEY